MGSEEIPSQGLTVNLFIGKNNAFDVHLVEKSLN